MATKEGADKDVEAKSAVEEESKETVAPPPPSPKLKDVAEPAAPAAAASKGDLQRRPKKSKVVLKAHRLILASCSPLIRKIFDNNGPAADVLTIHFPGTTNLC